MSAFTNKILCFTVGLCLGLTLLPMIFSHRFGSSYSTRNNDITSDNILCCICQNSAARELNMLHQP